VTTTFIGIDLAWQSDRNHSGIVVAQGDDSGATADVASAGISTLAGVERFVLDHATSNTVVAMLSFGMDEVVIDALFRCRRESDRR
jgi:hypothetical protein